MINFLRRIFIKDYKNVDDEKVREKHGKLASIVGIISNLLLFGFKMLIGIISGSVAIIADSINNLSDSSSSLISLIGFRLSAKPADKEHPYGHQRIEYIAGFMVSMVVIFVGFQLGYASINKIINNEKITVNLFTIIILGISILVKVWQAFFYVKVGNLIKSLTLKVTAMDSRNDVITTITILIGCIITYFVPNIPFSLDGVLGVFVSIFILISGIKMIKDTVDPLIGVSPDFKLVSEIIKDIESHELVLGIHDVEFHSYGPSKFFMTAHVEVSQDEPILKAHDIIDNIESEISSKYGVTLTIHMDPIDNKSSLVVNLKEEILSVLRQMDENISIHDFRIVKGQTHTNLIFDVLLPINCQIPQEEIIANLKEKINVKKRKYNFVIGFDRDFLGVDLIDK